MATDPGPPLDSLSWLERLELAPGSVDFHVALRRFECAHPELPRLGEGRRASDEPLRLGQPPSMTFEGNALARFFPAERADTSPPTDFPEVTGETLAGRLASAAMRGDTKRARLLVNFFGLWGPHGPLPLHVTEYARDRLRHFGDATLVRFADVFHHRLLLLFHRAWAKAAPTVGFDRPATDPFATYVGSFVGVSGGASKERDAFADRAKLYYAGRFTAAARSAEGLAAIVGDYFGMPAEVEEFVGEWTELPAESRWRLGDSPENGALGATAVLGRRVWTRGNRFRVVLGPLLPADAARMLPGTPGLRALTDLVRLFTNDEWGWDVRLVLGAGAAAPMCLGRSALLGWTTRLGAARAEGTDLIVDPQTRGTQRVRARRSSARGDASA